MPTTAIPPSSSIRTNSSARIAATRPRDPRRLPAGQLHFVCVLKGAFLFLGRSDSLARRPGHASTSWPARVTAPRPRRPAKSGCRRISTASIEGRDVIIVEDIVDTGLTLHYLQEILLARGPRSLRTACLLSKPTRRKIDVKVDYIGFTIEDRFVVGYGLDYAEQYRNLPYIGVLE